MDVSTSGTTSRCRQQAPRLIIDLLMELGLHHCRPSAPPAAVAELFHCAVLLAL